MIDAILRGDRVALGRALTLVESQRPDHRQQADTLLAACLPHAGKSVRVAITGTPGVGKSTFIESFGQYLIRSQERRVAVLAIDPSSRVSRGSILGDKTRMQTLSALPEAFIRPSPAGDTLGGVARRTRDSIILVEAAGFDTVMIETVGVGQSETAAHAMTDVFMLLLQPGAGDDLQGIKRGIVELADILVVNKADGANKVLATQAARAYKTALHMVRARNDQWTPPVLAASALENLGLDAVWGAIDQFVQHRQALGVFQSNRTEQTVSGFTGSLPTLLLELLQTHPLYAGQMDALKQAVAAGLITWQQAARQLLDVCTQMP
jgi:LAO/AO transport system kinase